MPFDTLQLDAAEVITLGDDSLPDENLALPDAHEGWRQTQAETQAVYRQMHLIVQDLRAAVAERNRALLAARRAQRDTLRRLVIVAASKDISVAHCLRVGAISALIGRAMGQSQAWCDMLFDTAPLHDIGKIGIPDAILQKPARLSPEEWETMKEHTLLGARILSGSRSGLEELAAEIALNHHEKWDGSGYPAGRTGRDIPLAGRIVAVADFFDSVSSDRCYRNAFDAPEVLTLVNSASGAQFDPEVVDALLRIYPRIAAIQARAAEEAQHLNKPSEGNYWWRSH
jgi:putative two-component system response regulator